MKPKKAAIETVSVVAPVHRDLLDLTVRELLATLSTAAVANDPGEWINIRDERYPWRRIVAAAERGECEVSRVGRRLMMRREELNRWLSRYRIGPSVKKAKTSGSDQEAEPEDELARSVRRSLERQGYRR